MGIFDAFSPDDAQQAAADQKASIQAGTTQASNLLNTGLNTSTGQFTQGVQPFLTNYATTNAGQQAYANAVGANGAAGSQQAMANFEQDPGYQYRLQQGTENYMRNAAATGALGSGGTAAGITKLGSDLANQGWQTYVNNLSPFINASTQNAAGVQQGYNAMGTNTAQNYGQQASLQYAGNVAQGNAQAASDMAPYQASQNILGAGMQIAKTAAAFV